jgi:hypothetical protein
MEPRGPDLFLEQRIVAEIDHHRVKTVLDPAIEGVQVTPARPQRGNTVPAIQLLLENLAAHFFLMVLTNRSACGFKFGDRGGSCTDFTALAASVPRNSVVNSGSRS